jgi:hypothetical protein
MPLPRRIVGSLLASPGSAGALAAATAQADGQHGPLAQTLAATDVSAAAATLHGTVDAEGKRTTYWFDIGATTVYGARTQVATTDKNEPVDVQSGVSGLMRGAVYGRR